MSDFHLNKMQRARTLAIKCSQSLDPGVAAHLTHARLRLAGDQIHLGFRGGATHNLTHQWIESGSVEQLAEALSAMAHEGSSRTKL
ncbi:MAG: hypothetical protein ACRYFS_16200 [Janthinobacterium lividum]